MEKLIEQVLSSNKPKVFVDIDETLIFRIKEWNKNKADPNILQHQLPGETNCYYYLLNPGANDFLVCLNELGYEPFVISTGTLEHQTAVCKMVGLTGFRSLLADMSEYTVPLTVNGPWVLLDNQCGQTQGVYHKLSYLGLSEAAQFQHRYNYDQHGEVVDKFFKPYFIKVENFCGNVQVPLFEYLPEIQEKLNKQL